MHTPVVRSTAVRMVLVAALVGAVFASASSAATSGVDKTAAALVPAKIKAKGTVIVASDASYAPNEFFASDGHTVVGWDVDLAKAIFPLLGLKVKVVNATFATIIPGLTSGKFDLGMSSFTDNKLREKQVDFVDYYKVGTLFFEKSSGGPKVTGLSSLCGLKVAVESGTTELIDATAQKAKCAAQHKAALALSTFPTQSNANLALSSGRAQVSMADTPIATYQVKQSNGAFKLVGQIYGVAPYGIAVPKQDGTLDKAILAALKDVIKNGQYATILKRWSVQLGADTHPVINGAIS
jgi:polar amino acid transport system substrate-binding protein